MTNEFRAPSRFALVIGINEYENASPLRCCVRDAKAMSALLTDIDRGIVSPDHMIELYDAEATAENIRGALAQLADWADHTEDTVWIYYSGHGAAIEDEEDTFIVAHDAAEDLDRETFVSATEFREAIEAIRASRIVVALDCCHAGGFTLRRTGAPAPHDAYGERIRRLLDRFSGSGRFIIASCNAEETSIEVNGALHGLFTKYLLDGLRGAADSDGNGVITPNELLQYLGVVEQHAAQHGHRQIFQFDGAFGANFVLVEVPGSRSASGIDAFASHAAEAGVSALAREALRRAPEAVFVPRELAVRRRNGFLGLGSGFESQPPLDEFPADRGYFRLRPEPSAPVRIPRTTLELGDIGEGAFGILEYHPRTLPCVLRFGGALRGNGFSHDLTLEAYWRIADFGRAAKALLRPLVPCSQAVCKQQVDLLLQNALHPRVLDIVREHELDAERVRGHAFTTRTWTSKLCEDNADLDGIELSIVSYSTDSTEERAALAAERERQRRSREIEIEAIRMKAAAEHSEKLRLAAEADARGEVARIEADRRRELEELEHRKRVLMLELELKEIAESRATERLRAELESERARNESEARRATESIAVLQGEMARMRTELDSKKALAILKAIPEITPRTDAGAVAEFSALHAIGLSNPGGERAGVPLANLLSTRASTGRLRLLKRDLQSRDIAIPDGLCGPTAISIPVLRKGSPLAFSIESEEPGYLTVLNFGTSGRIWLQTPNALLVPQDACIGPAAAEQVPGPRTVPIALLERHRIGYVESGPPGWETLIVVVSDRPLIRDTERAHHDSRYPFREIDQAFADALQRRLVDGEVGTWYASVVSFQVVD